ncbi:hypothetical protein CRYUN_Cryun27aG0073400 [Craigia yunnanensis]
MIKTLNPYSTTAKTAEIMSRYRPIAPKPEVPANSMNESSAMSQKIRQSPYLRNLKPQLQARTRKRGFSHGIRQLSVPNFVTSGGGLESSSTPPANLVTLPLLPCPPSIPVLPNKATVPALNCMEPCGGENVIDLNTVVEIPEEKDLLRQLQGPPTSSVIAPQLIRAVGSSITVGCINEDPSLNPTMQLPKKPEEVEEEVELEALPAVISDSNNKVRLANSAYKEMVGQPECPWFDSMVTGEGRAGGNSCKRICGEVMLHLSDSRVPVKSNGFSCWVRIEWGSEGKKSSIKAFCDVIRLSCQSRDYLFSWRLHTHNREASQSNSIFEI